MTAPGDAAGGCVCGALRYRMAAPPIFTNRCHCTDCQRITGSAFAINAMIETDALAITAGTPEIKTTPGGRGWHCGACGALLWADHPLMGDGIRFLRVGTLDDARAVEPDAHFFVKRKRSWVAIPAGLPAFAELPDGDPLDGLAPGRRARAVAAMRAV